MDSIQIDGLRMIAYHGVMEQERKVGNEFIVDVCLYLSDVCKAMTDDNIAHTVNYAEVVEIIKREMAIPSRLLENVAYRIRESIMQRYVHNISGGMVKVAKIAPPISAELNSVAFTTRW